MPDVASLMKGPSGLLVFVLLAMAGCTAPDSPKVNAPVDPFVLPEEPFTMPTACGEDAGFLQRAYTPADLALRLNVLMPSGKDITPSETAAILELASRTLVTWGGAKFVKGEERSRVFNQLSESPGGVLGFSRAALNPIEPPAENHGVRAVRYPSSDLGIEATNTFSMGHVPDPLVRDAATAAVASWIAENGGEATWKAHPEVRWSSQHPRCLQMGAADRATEDLDKGERRFAVFWFDLPTGTLAHAEPYLL